MHHNGKMKKKLNIKNCTETERKFKIYAETPIYRDFEILWCDKHLLFVAPSVSIDCNG